MSISERFTSVVFRPSGYDSDFFSVDWNKSVRDRINIPSKSKESTMSITRASLERS